MRTLSAQDIEDILLGATVLGAGGGGELSEGRELIAEAAALGKTFVLMDLADVPDDAIVCTPYMLGALSDTAPDADPALARLPRADRNPLLIAYERFQRHLGEDFHGVVACELGGSNTAAAFYCAAMNDHVIVDADPSGRAVPEIQHTTYAIAGLAPGDLVFANGFGECFIYENVYDDLRAEDIARALAIAGGNEIAGIDHALPMKDLRAALIGGTISHAETIGRTMRLARDAGDPLPQAIAGAGGGIVAFHGQITVSDWWTEDGFTHGTVVITAESGSEYAISFKNENMVGRLDGSVHATIPDIICIIDQTVGTPLTNPNASIGDHVAVVILPAPLAFRSHAGLKLFGPTYAGLDMPYRPAGPW